MRYLWVGAFGLAGVYSRFLIEEWLVQVPASLPWGTFGINMIGSFLAGVVYVAGVEHSLISPDFRIGVLVGFLGGFTTFSAYCLQSARLLEQKTLWPALLYLGLSPALGLGAALLGLHLTRLFLASDGT